MSSPPPATVPQGLWRDITPAEIGALEATARVSVVLDGDPAGAPATTRRLATQTYPTDLVEVIGPGSEAVPSGEIVIVLRAGDLPVPELVEAHARWHHEVGDAVSFGPVGRDRDFDDSSLGLVRDLTRDLTDSAGGLMFAAAEGSLGMRRELYDEAGAGPEGGETGRLDFAQRLHSAGAVFVAEADGWADGDPGEVANAVARACESGRTVEATHPALAAVVALPPFRAVASPRRHLRPAVAVNLAVGSDTATEDALGTVAGVLASRAGDFALRVQVDEGHPARAEVERALAADARAEIGPSTFDERCEAPVQIALPPAAALDPRTLGDLHELALGEEAGALHVTVPGVPPEEAMIEVVQTAVWRRARRLASASGTELEQVVAELGGERWISGVEASTRAHGVEEPHVTEHGPLAAATDLDHERNAHLRFRDRADDLTARAATLAQRTLAERLRAREERRAAERVEARLAERRRAR